MNEKEAKKINISYRLLLAICGIAPLFFLIAVIDILFLDGAIRPYVSLSVLGLFIYLFIFELNHIIASFFSFADREYISYYKNKLFIRLPIIIAIGFIIAYISPSLGLSAAALYLAYHVVAQQTGITKMIIGKKHILHDTWKMLAFFNVSVLLIHLFQFPPFAEILNPHVNTLLTTSIAIFLVVSLFIYKDIKKDAGKKFFLATTFIFLSSNFFFLTGYLFFAVFVLRFTHDVIAFIFYMAHDNNRNLGTIKNTMYKLLAPLQIPIMVLVPLIAIIISYVIRFEFGLYPDIIYFLILFGVAHYYIESFMWKYSSIHRHQLSFVK